VGLGPPPRPTAILAISGHWFAPGLTIGTLDHSQLLYDFYGFPAPLYQLQYPAPGATALARRVNELLDQTMTSLITEPSRRLDHGAWVPLLRLFPDADIPVLQLAQPAPLQPEQLFQLGRQLAPLRDEGALIMASGAVTHNLYQVDHSEQTPPPEWAIAFDHWVREVVEQRQWPTLLRAAESAPHFNTAHPSIEHFSPLWLAAGAARPQEPISSPATRANQLPGIGVRIWQHQPIEHPVWLIVQPLVVALDRLSTYAWPSRWVSWAFHTTDSHKLALNQLRCNSSPQRG